MIKYLTVCCLWFGLVASAQINVENDSIIIWNKNRKITWDDFLSEKVVKAHKYNDINKENASAVIVVSIKIYPKEFDCRYISHLEIVAQMNKNISCAKLKTAAVLNHEQTHFDIAELYARKIRKAIAEFIETSEECDLQGIADIYYHLVEEHWQTQFLYDDEVRECEDRLPDFCHNLEKQQEWDKRIGDSLEIYKDYELIIDIDDLELE